MIRKPGSIALSGMALVCAAILAACNSAPSLRQVVVAPHNGTIYVSTGPGGGVKGARRGTLPSANKSRSENTITPSDIASASGCSLQYTATAYFSDGSTQDKTGLVTWKSSNTSVAQVDPSGRALGVGLGIATIDATLTGVPPASVQLEVDKLESITVTAPSASIAQGASELFTATGTFTLAAGGSAMQDITGQVTWSSSNMGVATIDNTGNATAVGGGTTMITATSCDGLVSNSFSLTVTAAVTGLVISPMTPAIATGTSVLLTAQEMLAGGGTGPLTGAVTWQSATTSVAMIDPTSGNALAIGLGTSMITATEAGTGATGTVTLTVQPAAARYAYVGNFNGAGPGGIKPGGGTIYSYTVDAGAGTLGATPVSSAAASPQQVLLHPSGHLLYYINGNGQVYSNVVHSTSGALAPTMQGPKDASGTPTLATINNGVIDPFGRFLYVTTFDNSTLYGFAITQSPGTPATDGALTGIPGMTPYVEPTATINSPSWIMTDRLGQFLYVVNNGNSTISQYSINQTTGALTQLGTKTIATGNGTNSPEFGSTDASGHLFVANFGSGLTQTVTSYSIQASGANAGELTLIGDTTISGATQVVNAVPDPSGKYLYVLDQNASGGNGQIITYGLSSGTLSNSPIGTAPFPATGVNPNGIAVDPSSSMVAVDNFGDGTTAVGSLSLFQIAQAGSVTPPPGALKPASTPTVATDYGPLFVVFYTALSGQ